MSYYPRRKLVMLPGPTNVPDRVTNAMLKAIVNHRGPDFRPLLNSIKGKLQSTLETTGDVVVLSSSGTGGVEASVKNIVKRGDNIIVPVFGEFSGRLAEQIKEEGGNVTKVETQPGTAPTPDMIDDAAKRIGQVKAIYVVYNDTSPGTTYRWLKEVGDIAHAHGGFVIADSISIVGGDELPQDKWGVDMVVGASQKCIGAPPGIAFITMSQAMSKYVTSNVPTTTYFNLSKYLEFMQHGETPFTPALPLFYAFDEALTMVQEEGMPKRIERHRTTASAFYDALTYGGLHPFVEPKVRSNVVVTVKLPDGVDDTTFRGTVEDKFNVILAGGFGPLKGKIFRIGNMGDVNRYHVIVTLNAIGSALGLMGRQVDVTGMVRLAEERLKQLAPVPNPSIPA
jgi:aspartate aminotransferase-like enzyme